MSQSMLKNMMRIEDPETPIFRIFRLNRLCELLRTNRLTLVRPAAWDDPWENLLQYCALEFRNVEPWEQKFFDQIRKPVYGQCWSLQCESDALWRIYSTVNKNFEGRNDSKDCEGIKVRTTARKLLSALWNHFTSDPSDSCFIGQVRYMSGNEISQEIANEAGRLRLSVYADGRGHAESFLFKRQAFDHEREVRLLYVEKNNKASEDFLSIPIDPNDLFDEMIFDPRLLGEDVHDREIELRDLGFRGTVKKSTLYQRTLLIIPID